MSSPARTPLLLLCLLLIAAEPPATPPEKQPPASDDKRLPTRSFVRMGSQRLQQEYGRAIAFAPDGKTVAIHDSLWDVTTGKKHCDLQIPEWAGGGIWKLAFAPDGKIVAGECYYCVRLWETATGKQVRELSCSERVTFHALSFSPDGKQLATSIWGEKGKLSSVLLWDTATGREIRRFTGFELPADQLAFSPDGKRLTVLVIQPTFPCSNRRDPSSCYILSWDVTSSKQLFSRTRVSPGAFSRDGNLYTLQGEDGRIEIHERDKRRLLRTLESRDVWHVFSEDGKLLACADNRNTIRIWDIASGRLLKQMSGRREESKHWKTVYYPFGFSPDGKFLVTGSHDSGNHAGRVRLWNVPKGEELLPAEDHYLGVTCLAFTADSKTLISGGADRTLNLWDTTIGRHLRRFTGHKDRIDAVALSPTGSFLASSGRDQTLRLWDDRTGRELQCLDAPAKGALSFTILADDKTLQWWDVQGNIHCYDVSSGQQVRRFRSRRGVFHAAPLGSDGLGDPIALHEEREQDSLIVWPEDLLPPVLRQEREKDKKARKEKFHPLCHIRVSADGRMAATVEYIYSAGGETCQIRVWEVATSGLIADLGQPSGCSFVCMFSHNGLGFFVGCEEGPNFLKFPHQGWDLLTGKRVVNLQAPSETLRCMTLSPDGTKIAAAAHASVVVWDIAGLFQPPAAPPLSETELRRLVDCLSETDAAAAYRAMYRLARSPEQCVPYLHDRLRKLTLPAQLLRGLIADLDDDDFAVREKATKTLVRLGPSAESTLRRARECFLTRGNAPSEFRAGKGVRQPTPTSQS